MELFRHAALVILSSKMLSESQNIGYKAEENALSFLVRQGLDVVERNFRCRFGEIDLIMRDGDVLVFVEVRKRKTVFSVVRLPAFPRRNSAGWSARPVFT